MLESSDNLNTTIGALLLGALFTAAGFGITTMQTYMYVSRFPNDHKITHYTVWTIFCLDTSHVILTWHMSYWYLILNYNNSENLNCSIWSFDVTVVITAVITLVAHCFYARRVYILARHNWITPSIIMALSSIRLIFGCYVTAKLFEIRRLNELWQRIGAEVGLGIGAGTAADIVIAVSLVWLLRRHRGYNVKTDNLLDTITLWAISNGILTSIVGVVVIITMVTMPNNMVYLALHLVLSKLYANSLLAALNFRKVYRGRGIEESDEDIRLSTMRRRSGSNLEFSAARDTQNGRVHPVVRVTTTTMTDAEHAHPEDYAMDLPKKVSIQ